MKLVIKYSEMLFQISSETNKDNLKEDVNTFLSLVKMRGHEKLLTRILAEFERKIMRIDTKTSHTLTVARVTDVDKAKEELKKIRHRS